MSTAAMQLQVQRHRFVHHAVGALIERLPAQLRSLMFRSALASPAVTVSELAARQAQEVREMARAYQQTDPGFAADLYAAAARHEGLSAD